MTEREKQLAGELYCHQDEEISNAFQRCAKLLQAFHATAYDDEEGRQRIIRSLLNAKGTFHIERGFTCVFGSNITIGDNFFANYNVQLLDPNTIEIGDNALLAPNVILCTAGHPLDASLRIGAGAIVLPGVTIGDRVVIGAGAVVNRDLPDDCVAVGNPARVIKRLEPPK